MRHCGQCDRRNRVTLKADFEGEIYRLEFSNGTRLIGFSELAAPALGGRDVLVSGKRDGNVLYADYLKVVDGDDSDIVVVGEHSQ